MLVARKEDIRTGWWKGAGGHLQNECQMEKTKVESHTFIYYLKIPLWARFFFYVHPKGGCVQKLADVWSPYLITIVSTVPTE